MFEISERRYDRGATIFCSQFDPSAWHVQLGGGPMVEAMLDRITSNAYTMVLTGESMRVHPGRMVLSSGFGFWQVVLITR